MATPAAFQHDEEDIELGGRVFDQLMTGRPGQEGRVAAEVGKLARELFDHFRINGPNGVAARRSAAEMGSGARSTA